MVQAQTLHSQVAKDGSKRQVMVALAGAPTATIGAKAERCQATEDLLDVQLPICYKVVFIAKAPSAMQLETGKQDLPDILVEDQAAQSRNAVVAPMNAETVHVFAAPIQDQLENFVELGDAGFAGDQETPPDQWTRASEHDSQLIKLGHGRRLPKPAPNFPTTPPGISRSPAAAP